MPVPYALEGRLLDGAFYVLVGELNYAWGSPYRLRVLRRRRNCWDGCCLITCGRGVRPIGFWRDCGRWLVCRLLL